MSEAEAKPRLLHTMLRVADLARTEDFYGRLLGMKVLRRLDFEQARFSLLFMGYESWETGTHVEFTHNWDQDEPYEMGNAFGHLAIAVEDVYAFCAKLEAEGVEIPRAPGPMKGGPVLAFIKDPDGYAVEVLQLNTE